MRSAILATAAAVGLLSPASAQFCSDNTFPPTLVNSQGVPASSTFNSSTGLYTYQFTNNQVYLAFPTTLASGTYYVHVTDPLGNGDEVLSTNDPMDRFVAVTNNGGVISLSLPFTNGQNPPVFGLGLNGVGQSLLLAPFRSSLDEPCQYKAWFGDCWDLSAGPANPYLLSGGLHPVTGNCCVRSYELFNVGGGSGNNVCGRVFLDTNHNGVQDPGEGGVANVSVQLTGAGPTQTAVTGGNGGYCVANVAQGSYTVVLALGTPSPYNATTPTSFPVAVLDCADVTVPSFGVAQQVLACNGHTIGFWRNNNGKALVTQYGILATLPGLCLVNASGQYVAPATLSSWASWLQNANATNMAYMLSAQLAAMHCNVSVGFVDMNCVIHDSVLGNLTIASLMQQAIASLCAYPYTPSGHAQRAAQEQLKNALDNANNNLNWL
ncbi:MAG: SdrD B-like domain-containing protein [Planctomycetota bacterium]